MPPDSSSSLLGTDQKYWEKSISPLFTFQQGFSCATFQSIRLTVSLACQPPAHRLRANKRLVINSGTGCRWHPKFTFSTFTPDPNLQNPHLHKTQIYTNSNLHSSDLHTPKFTKPHIGIPKLHNSNLHQTEPKFTQPEFTQPKFTQKPNL